VLHPAKSPAECYDGGMTTIIVDDEGEPWGLSLPSLRRRLDCPSAISDLAEFAVNVRGFVALHSRGRSTIELRFRPSIVQPVALVKAAELLGERDGIRVVMKSSEASAPFLGDRNRSIAQLLACAADAQSTRKDDFVARRHMLPSASADADFGRLLEVWNAAPRTKSACLLEAVRAASGGRYLEVVPDYASDRLVIDRVGDGYSLYGKGWRSVAVGGRFEDMPDFEYARWAAQAYRDASRAREPIFEDVAAAVDLPPAGRLLLTYRRVILPLGAGDRPAVLLGATLGQKVARLGLEAGDEAGDVAQ
jgi:hypothetical protein